MRILFIVPYTPNLIRVRPYNLIRHLSDRGHQVTVLTLSTGPKDEEDATVLKRYCHDVIQTPISRWRFAWNCIGGLLTNAPIQSAYSWQPAMADGLSKLINTPNGKQPFDIVHVEHLRGVRYGLTVNNVSQSTGQSLPVIWDSVDCISLLFRQASNQSKSTLGRLMTKFELGRTERYERWLIKQFNQVLVTSKADKEALIHLSDSYEQPSNLNVVPNGVDLEYFRPLPGVVKEQASLVVSGKMSYHANITMVLDLVQNILPLVWKKRENVKLCIVGKDPSPSIQKLAANPLVSVTSEVKDIRPYLQRATVAVAPVAYGAGIQNKVLEAMACSTPVITSSKAADSLQALNGRDLLVADGAEAFARTILNLIADTKLQRQLRANGRLYVESHHQWSEIAGQLEEIYQRSIQD